MEGLYIMVFIDGMFIVSSLVMVYGLLGILNLLVECMEIVKGLVFFLYGSEVIGGLINIIIKFFDKVLFFSVDVMGISWEELNVDVGVWFNVGVKVFVLIGVNYYYYDNLIDNNNDNFIDVIN